MSPHAAGEVIGKEGLRILTTGLGATAAGYFVQGWFKFGGVEVTKSAVYSLFWIFQSFFSSLFVFLGVQDQHCTEIGRSGSI